MLRTGEVWDARRGARRDQNMLSRESLTLRSEDRSLVLEAGRASKVINLRILDIVVVDTIQSLDVGISCILESFEVKL